MDRLEISEHQLSEVQLGAAAEQLLQLLRWLRERQLRVHVEEYKAAAYFGPLLRRMRVASPIELEDELEKVLTLEELCDVFSLDVLVVGHPRRRGGAPEVWLAVEVALVIDREDVERAGQRAGYLRRAGYRAVPTVAGKRVTEEAWDAARTQKVLVLQDGRAELWDEALGEVLRS